jgi:membrane-associated protein
VQLIDWIRDLLKNPGHLIEWGGYPGLAAIIFLETGAMVFFLPGDSLLFVAGLYAAQGHLNIGVLLALLIPMAVLGDATSYYIGKKTGPALFKRPKSLLFRPEYAQAAHDFYEKHGGIAIIMARFAPIVRTFVPVIAGVAQMKYSLFARYNVIGAALWITSMTVLGYYLGQIEMIRDNLDKVLVIIVLLSILPGIIGVLRARFGKKNEPSPSAE